MFFNGLVVHVYDFDFFPDINQNLFKTGLNWEGFEWLALHSVGGNLLNGSITAYNYT